MMKSEWVKALALLASGLVLFGCYCASGQTLEWEHLPQRYCDGRDCVGSGGYCARPVEHMADGEKIE
jgi:hypothetical protein